MVHRSRDHFTLSWNLTCIIFVQLKDICHRGGPLVIIDVCTCFSFLCTSFNKTSLTFVQLWISNGVSVLRYSKSFHFTIWRMWLCFALLYSSQSYHKWRLVALLTCGSWQQLQKSVCTFIKERNSEGMQDITWPKKMPCCWMLQWCHIISWDGPLPMEIHNVSIEKLPDPWKNYIENVIIQAFFENNGFIILKET